MAIVTAIPATHEYAGAPGLLGDAERIRTSALSRFSPLDGIGQDLRAAKTYEEALAISGLGFIPAEEKLVTVHGVPVVGYKALFNGPDLLSVVKKEYLTVSNTEAFLTADDLVAFENFVYEVSNMVNHGAKSRLFLSGPIVMIEGEEFTPYAVFNNSFDLSKSVSVEIVFLRAVSKSGYMRRGPGIESSVTFTHFGAKEPKLKKLARFKAAFSKTVGYLQMEASKLRALPYTRLQFIEEIIPIAVAHAFQRPKDTPITQRQQSRVLAFVESLLSAYDTPDLQPFDGTAYKAVLAMADIDSHLPPFINRGNADLYANRLLQDGLRPSLANTVANYFSVMKPATTSMQP